MEVSLQATSRPKAGSHSKPPRGEKQKSLTEKNRDCACERQPVQQLPRISNNRSAGERRGDDWSQQRNAERSQHDDTDPRNHPDIERRKSNGEKRDPDGPPDRKARYRCRPQRRFVHFRHPAESMRPLAASAVRSRRVIRWSGRLEAHSPFPMFFNNEPCAVRTGVLERTSPAPFLELFQVDLEFFGHRPCRAERRDRSLSFLDPFTVGRVENFRVSRDALQPLPILERVPPDRDRNC